MEEKFEVRIFIKGGDILALSVESKEAAEEILATWLRWTADSAARGILVSPDGKCMVAMDHIVAMEMAEVDDSEAWRNSLKDDE